MAWHSISIYSPTGVFLEYLRWKSIDCTLAERSVAVLTIALFPEYSDALFQRDCRIAYQKEAAGLPSGKLVGDTLWLLTRRERMVNEQGQHSIVLTCQHPNAILERRVVAYDEGSVEADKNDIASDVLYDYLDENLVTATDTARNLSTSHFVLDPRPGPTFGPTVDIAGSYRSLLDILQDATQAAAAQGVYIGYEVYVPTLPGPFRLRLYRNQRGANRGLTSGQALMINTFSARMTRASVAEDWSSAVSFVYAGGGGKLDERVPQTAEDATLSAQSPFGRFERFESFNTDDAAVLTSEAQKVLRDYRPRREFDALVSPVAEQYSGAIYDVNYTWGDVVGAQFSAPIVSGGAGGEVSSWITYQFDVRVNPVHLQVVRQFDQYQNEIGTEETIEIFLQSVESS